MTKITVDDLIKTTEFIKKHEQTAASFGMLVDQIAEDQGADFIEKVSLIGIVNLDILRGFMLCYFTIRRVQKKQASDELERMFKLGE